MSERLDDLRRRVGETRRGLEEALRRLSAVRERLGPRQATDEAAPAPLFPGLGTGSGAIAETELQFEALDTEVGAEGSKREER